LLSSLSAPTLVWLALKFQQVPGLGLGIEADIKFSAISTDQPLSDFDKADCLSIVGLAIGEAAAGPAQRQVHNIIAANIAGVIIPETTG